MKKLDDKTVNAIAHNIIIDQVLNVAWDFVCSLAPTNEFDYAHVNSATEDYCDTSWHVTQNVTLHQSLDLIDAKDMYDNAWDNYNMLLDTNTQKLSASSIFKQLDDISGDTAMRANYYSMLHDHFEQFANSNKDEYSFTKDKYYEYTFTNTHSAQQKRALVEDYLSKYNATEYIELNNELA